MQQELFSLQVRNDYFVSESSDRSCRVWSLKARKHRPRAPEPSQFVLDARCCGDTGASISNGIAALPRGKARFRRGLGLM